MNETEIQELRARFRGEMITPGDAAYEAARKVYNGMIDRRPALIARCADVADVIAAVNFAREKTLLLAVRGGGHNGPGLGVCDGGLVIDLSRLKGIRVDQQSRSVRVEGGCLWGDVDHATHAFGGYVNMMMDEGEDTVKAAYRDDHARLAQAKRKYDPDNLFRVNQNIRPADV